MNKSNSGLHGNDALTKGHVFRVAFSLYIDCVTDMGPTSTYVYWVSTSVPNDFKCLHKVTIKFDSI